LDSQPGKIARRKRKTPQRRVPSVIEQPERKAMAFGWGTDLSHREREAVKERIALLAGIALAVIIAGLVGWGLLQDNVLGPGQARDANNKPVAQIGSATITTGFFQRFEQFRSNQLASQLTQFQQQQQQLNANPKQNAAQIAQVSAQISSLQQSQGTISQASLQLLLDDQTMLQRARTMGVSASPKAVNDQIVIAEKNAGGKLHFQQFLKTSNLSYDEFKMLVSGDILRAGLSKKLAAAVNPYEIKVRASHILVAPKQKALAQKLLSEAKAGSNFAALARKYTIDTGSKVKGGDLGYFGHGTMVAPFDKAAFSMKVGEVRLVQSQYGWHVIKLTGRRRMHMTSQELQTAQSSALQSWLAKQQGNLHVQRFVALNQLPGVVTTPSAISTQPASVPLQVPTSAPQQLPTQAAKTSSKKKP
jgi:parvulin-like peptidyl-prolyl isomerase